MNEIWRRTSRKRKRERVGEDVAEDLLDLGYPLIDDDCVTINVYTSLSYIYSDGYS